MAAPAVRWHRATRGPSQGLDTLTQPNHDGAMTTPAGHLRYARAARAWHAATCVVASAALLLQTWLVLRGVPVLADIEVPPLPIRSGRLISYFTIQSNLLVAVTSAMLALRPDRDGSVFRVVRLDAVVGITLTGVVHFVALRPVLRLVGWSWWADLGLHILTPALCVTAWLLVGPRPRIDRRTCLLAALWPLAWLAWTLAIGALTGWYPYPFLNAGQLGYPPVLVACLVITGVFGALLATGAILDRRLRPAPGAIDTVTP